MTPLADELLLLALDDVSGRPTSRAHLDLGLAGAVLVDLALAGRVDMADGCLVVTDATLTGDVVADAVLARIAERQRARRPKDWVRRLAKGLRGGVVDRLVSAGVLRREKHKVLGLFPTTRLPARSQAVESDARARLDAAVLRGHDPEPRTAALVALVQAANLRKMAFPDADRKAVERRMSEIAEGTWAAEAVRQAVQDIHAGVAAATAAASAATAAGS